MPVGITLATAASIVAISTGVLSLGIGISDIVASNNKDDNDGSPEANTTETTNENGADTGSLDTASELIGLVDAGVTLYGQAQTLADDTADNEEGNQGEDSGNGYSGTDNVLSDIAQSIADGTYESGSSMYETEVYDGPTAEQAAYYSEYGVIGRDDVISIWEAAYYAEYGTSIYGEEDYSLEVNYDTGIVGPGLEDEDSSSGYGFVVAAASLFAYGLYRTGNKR